MLHAVRVRLEEGRSLIIDDAGGGLSLEVKGIVARKAHFDEAFAALHGIQAGTDEISIEENVSGGSHEVDVIQLRLKNLRVSADGAEIEFAGALRANQRAAGGLDDDVAGNFF